MQVIAGHDETGVARGDEIALRLTERAGAAAVLDVDQARIGVGDFPIEHAELRIGANRLFDRKPRGTAIEGRMGVGRRQRTRASLPKRAISAFMVRRPPAAFSLPGSRRSAAS